MSDHSRVEGAGHKGPHEGSGPRTAKASKAVPKHDKGSRSGGKKASVTIFFGHS